MRTLLRKIAQLTKVLMQFVSTQIIVQILGAGMGVLIVNSLSVHDYAVYTMANTMQSTLIALADVGLTSALSASAGRVWEDRHRLGQVITTGLQMRRMLAGIALVVVIPILAWTFLKNHVSPLYATLIGVAVLLGAGARMTGDVYSIVLKIKGHVKKLQMLDLISAVVRVVFVGILYFVTLNALLTVIVGSLALFVQNYFLRIWVQDDIDITAPPHDEDRKAIVSAIKQQLVNTIYYCAQGQISIFIISLYGKTSNIAEIGALGRIAIIFTIIAAVFNNIVMPRFARERDWKNLIRIYALSLLALAIFSGVLFLVVALFPREVLWILGKNYSHLRVELTYTVISSIVMSFTGLIFGLNAARAWFRYLWVTIPIMIAVQGFFAHSMDLSKVTNVILFVCVPYGISCIVPLYTATIEILRLKNGTDQLAEPIAKEA